MKILGKGFTRAALLCGAAMAAPMWAAPALAAEADQANSNDIIVTAQRRNEKLEEVPMAVTVVTADTLANAGVTSLRDLANVTSGYQLGGGGAFPQPAIRGITTVINGTFENNVAVYIDGLYQPVAAALNIDLPNIDSIQVLKGPQGTLYGRNATGGALLLGTSNPTDTWHGKAEFTYAKFDDKRGSASISGPLGEKVGLSVAGYVRRSDGYMKMASRTTPGATTCCAVPVDQDAFRAKLKFQLTDAFKATLAYNYTRVRNSATNVYSPIENVASSFLRPGGLTRPTTLGVEAYDFDEVMQTKQHEGGLTLELDTGAGTLKSITGYAQVETDNRFDFGGTYIPDSYSLSLQRERTFQQAVDFTTSAIDKIDLTVGANYFHDTIGFVVPSTAYTNPNVSGPNSPAVNTGATQLPLSEYIVAQRAFFDQKKNAWAIYADLTFHATDRLSLNVGGRYSEEKQEVVASQTSVFPSSVRNSTSVSSKFKKFTPRASVRYEIAPRTNVYFTYSQGFRSGAYNSQLPSCVNNAVLDPLCYVPAKQESINSYELGFKTAGRNFRFEMAGFYYDYKDLQVSATRSLLINGTNFPVVEISNAPKAKVYGAEASFEYEPVENLKIRGSATWLHARYGQGFIFSGVGVTNASGVGINTNVDPLKTYLNQNQFQDLNGLQMSRAPDFSANLGMDYNIPNGEGGIRLSANVKYTSKYVLTNPSVWGAGAGVPVERQREQRFVEGAYALVNASVTWTDPTNHYYVRAWGTNLTNHKYRLHYSGTGSGTYSPQAEPLSFGGTIGYKF